MQDGQGLRLIEPLRELFKDEVRSLGRELGIYEELVMRYVIPRFAYYDTQCNLIVETHAL